jgi:hypothetical protein
MKHPAEQQEVQRICGLFHHKVFLIPYMELRVLDNNGMVLRAVRCSLRNNGMVLTAVRCSLRNNGMVLRAVWCSLRNLNSTEAQRRHENHQCRPKLTSYSETQPQETYEQGEKKPPVHSTVEKVLPIVSKKGPG